MTQPSRPMNAFDNTVKVASSSRPGVFHTVTLPTCSCENYTLSGRLDADEDKHTIVGMRHYLARRGYTIVPTKDICPVCASVAAEDAREVK